MAVRLFDRFNYKEDFPSVVSVFLNLITEMSELHESIQSWLLKQLNSENQHRVPNEADFHR